MNYLQQHWHGQHSLPRSFWVNGVGIGLSAHLAFWLLFNHIEPTPFSAMNISLSSAFFTHLMLFTWQSVGIMKAAENHIDLTGYTLWSRLTQVTILIGVFNSTLGVLESVKQTVNYVTIQNSQLITDSVNDYSLTFNPETNQLNFAGNINHGLTQYFGQTVETLKPGTRLELNSIGGNVYEARGFAKLVEHHKLNTHVSEECSSACLIIYAAGEKRTATSIAKLGFHQYRISSVNTHPLISPQEEQRKDLHYFKQRRFDEHFLGHIFKAQSNEIWYPTIETLQRSGVIDQVIDS